jgi:hypothetical protein
MTNKTLMRLELALARTLRMRSVGAMAGLPQDVQCVVCYGPGDYRVERRPLPEVGEGEVLVRVLAVGICAGDAKCFAGAPYFWGQWAGFWCCR